MNESKSFKFFEICCFLLRIERSNFRFEFVTKLHFGNSVHEVFESTITGRFVQESAISYSVSEQRYGFSTR